MDSSTKALDSQEKETSQHNVRRTLEESEFTRNRKTARPGRYIAAQFQTVQKIIQEQADDPATKKPPRPDRFLVSKTARDTFSRLSKGELELLSNVYYGDERRHEVYHRACGHHSLISLRELKDIPHDMWCPHCNGTPDLRRYGTIEQLQVSAYHASGHGAYIYASNSLGEADEIYSFWCVRHCRSYETTYSNFHRNRGRTNGCPLCREHEKKREDEISNQ